jgi:transmembrane protein
MSSRLSSAIGPGVPYRIARALDNPATLFAARICLVLPFVAGGLTKLFLWDAGVTETAGLGLHPAWAFNLATLLTELGGSMLVILDRKTWLGAGALGVFTVLATFLGHRFWEYTGPERQMQLNSFLEHATIAAAFILVVVVAIRNEQATLR